MSTDAAPSHAWLADVSTTPPHPRAQLWLLVWALVVLVSLLSVYVQVLHEQIDRGERFRQAQRSAVVVGKSKAKHRADDARPAPVVVANSR
jgi:hypothetical protein